ncbi:hypothetical protein QTP86_015800, partial [Hemibagrus guttatus]
CGKIEFRKFHRDPAIYTYCKRDTTVMLLFFIFIVVKNIGAVDSSITPDQTIISSSEGSIITLTCTYDDSDNYLHWYRQNPHSEPEFLLLIYESAKSDTKAAHDPRLSTKVRKKEKKVYFGLES